MKRAILIGLTGHGKSTVGCILLNSPKIFRCSGSIFSCTQEISEKSAEVKGSEKSFDLTVTDVPGFDDTSDNTFEIVNDLINHIKSSPPHLIILVLKHGRMLSGFTRTFTILRSCFPGIRSENFLIIHNYAPRPCEMMSEESCQEGITSFQEGIKNYLEDFVSSLNIVLFPECPEKEHLQKLRSSVYDLLVNLDPIDPRKFRSWSEVLQDSRESYELSKKNKEEDGEEDSEELKKDLSDWQTKTRLLSCLEYQGDTMVCTFCHRQYDDHGVSPKAPINDRFLKAAQLGRSDLVISLLDQKADINSRDRFDRTAFSASIQRGHSDVVEALLESKIDLKEYPDVVYTAVIHNNLLVLKVLIEHKADVNKRDSSNKTPLYYAVLGKREGIINLLRQNGAE